MPKFAHLPLILKPDGNGKLSKRDGDRLGFPVFPIAWKDPATGDLFTGYREAGYLPEAFINILAHLGWNPGTEKEIFSLQELIEDFTLERVGKHGAKFDFEKAKWYNHQYMVKEPDDVLAGYLNPILEENGLSPDINLRKAVVSLIKDRVFLKQDLWINSWFFFMPPTSYDQQVMAKIWKPDTARILQTFQEEIASLEDFSTESLHTFIQQFCERHNVKMGQLMNPLRLLTVGSNQGPGMTDIITLIGKKEFQNRILNGLSRINADLETIS
jgi:glutamyl-tRNA synthetase